MGCLTSSKPFYFFVLVWIVIRVQEFLMEFLLLRNTGNRKIFFASNSINKLCGRPPQYASAPCKLTFDLLTLKVVTESRVMWPTSVPIFVFLCLSVLDLGPMYATDRQTSDAHHCLMSLPYGRGHNNSNVYGA